MSDVFSAVARQMLGHVPRLRPIAPGLFEPPAQETTLPEAAPRASPWSNHVQEAAPQSGEPATETVRARDAKPAREAEPTRAAHPTEDYHKVIETILPVPESIAEIGNSLLPPAITPPSVPRPRRAKPPAAAPATGFGKAKVLPPVADTGVMPPRVQNSERAGELPEAALPARLEHPFLKANGIVLPSQAAPKPHAPTRVPRRRDAQFLPPAGGFEKRDEAPSSTTRPAGSMAPTLPRLEPAPHPPHALPTPTGTGSAALPSASATFDIRTAAVLNNPTDTSPAIRAAAPGRLAAATPTVDASIEIIIGRIDIRAEAPAPSRALPRPEPHISLADYKARWERAR